MPIFYRFVTLFIFVYDVTNKNSFDNVRSYSSKVPELNHQSPSFKFLIANKIDLTARLISTEVCYFFFIVIDHY